MTKDIDHGVLLGVAGRLFRERGFEGTTIRDIANAAGMYPGSVHYRFPAKESLLHALMVRGMERALAETRAAIATSDDPLERIRLAIRRHLDLLVAGDDAVYVLLYDLRSLHGEDRASVVALRDAYEALWNGLLYAAIGAKQIRGDIDIRIVRHCIIGAVNWTAQWYRDGGALSPTEIADAYMTIFINGIRT